MTEALLLKKAKILDAERIGRMIDRMAHEIVRTSPLGDYASGPYNIPESESDEDVIAQAREEAQQLVSFSPDLAEFPGLARLVADLVDEQSAEYLEKA